MDGAATRIGRQRLFSGSNIRVILSHTRIIRQLHKSTMGK